ncbi:MAG: type IV secretion system DNA-binding domain-containing protein [Burkholderiaceae bacterium]
MRHEYSLYFSALFFSFMIAVMGAMGTFVFSLNAAMSGTEGEIFLTRLVAQYKVATDEPSERVDFNINVNGEEKKYSIPSVVFLQKTAGEWADIKVKLWVVGAVSIFSGLGIFFLTNWAWQRFGRGVGVDEVVRGTQLADVNDVKAEMQKNGKAGKVHFAGVPLEAGKEVLNMMVSGAIGTGKSVAISEALSDIRQSGMKAFVFDPTGEYIQRFYRPGVDVILNPFDERSPLWRPWNEVRMPYDYANLAESFIPVTNPKEKFWEEGAQAVLEDVMSRLAKEGRATNRNLVEVVNLLSLAEIQQLVRALPGAVYMDPEAGKTSLGIRMNVVKAAKALRFMGDGEGQFSVRGWVEAGGDGWLFLSTREDMLVVMRPLLTAWFDTALRAVMTLPPDRNRLIWNVMDELASLNKIPTLKEATTRARKYGLASILGYQNIAQLREIYGFNDAQTIVSSCQSTLTLRVPDHQTAEFIAKNLGSQEIYERDENISFGAASANDGVSITTKRVDKALVMTSEIQGLPDLMGYMRLAGRNDVMKVQLSYREYPSVAEPFVMKEVLTYALD